MKKILLDTHVLIWLANGKGVGTQALAYLHEEADIITVSALSVLEIRVKQAAGKLFGAELVLDSISQMNIEVLDFSEQQSRYYSLFSQHNRDPFDNALVSIAVSERIPFMTADTKILALKYPGLVCVNAKA